MKRSLLFVLCLLMLCGCAAAPIPTASSDASAESTVLQESANTEAESAAVQTDTTQAAVETEPQDTLNSEDTADDKNVFSFSAEDRNGKFWTQADFSEYRLVLMNFWEPWCGPCVGEMPDLQKLYENYSEKGLLILGVYSTVEQEEEVQAILADAGITYPILIYSEDFNPLQTGYVPTTVLFSSAGAVMKAPFAGAMDYESWAMVVEAFLQ